MRALEQGKHTASALSLRKINRDLWAPHGHGGAHDAQRLGANPEPIRHLEATANLHRHLDRRVYRRRLRPRTASALGLSGEHDRARVLLCECRLDH